MVDMMMMVVVVVVTVVMTMTITNLIIQTELTEGGNILGPLDHHHQLLLHRLTDVMHVRWSLLLDAHRGDGHTHLQCTQYTL